MHWEVEQKFRLRDPGDVEGRLAELGAEFRLPIEQIDNYFRHPSRDFAKTDEALRLRQVGNESCITYKGPKVDPTTKTRRELELTLPSGAQSLDQFSELLTALGFTPAGTVKKQRRVASIDWQGFAVECALDQVYIAGSFIELEISADDQSLEAARKSLESLASHLKLGVSERRSYLELVLIATA